MAQGASKTILFVEMLMPDPAEARTAIARTGEMVSVKGGTAVNAVGAKAVYVLPDQDTAATTAGELMNEVANRRARMCICQLPGGVESREALSQAITAAARELAKAVAGQVVAPQETTESLPKQYEIKYWAPTEGGQRVFEIIAPQQDAVTRMAFAGGKAGKKLRIWWKGKDGSKMERLLDREHPVITFGREAGNDVAVESSMASRKHGRLEYRLGSLYLIDESTNGTFLFPDPGVKAKLQRESVTLPSRGYFCLGEELDENHADAIHFASVFFAG